MVKRNNFYFKSTKVPACNISSWCTSSWRAVTEHRKVLQVWSRNLKSNSFQKGRAIFQTTVDFDKEHCNTSSYIWFGVLIPWSISIAVMHMGEATIRAKGLELLLDAFQFVGISSYNRVPNDWGILKLWSNGNCNIQAIKKRVKRLNRMNIICLSLCFQL